METDEVPLNNLLPDEILVKIFEYYDYKVLKNMCLVSPRWLDLIGNTSHIFEKFPLVINPTNITEMTNPKVKCMRQYKPTEIVVKYTKFREIVDIPKICDYFATAKTVKFKQLNLADIRDMLNLCRLVEKVSMVSPSVLRENDEADDNNEMRVKRLKLAPTRIDLALYLSRHSQERDELDDLLQVLDELNIELKTLSLSFGDVPYNYFAAGLDEIESRHPNCVLTSLDLNQSQWNESDYTHFVERLDEVDNVKLTHFGLPYSDKMKEADLVDLMTKQREIKNLKIKKKHAELLRPYAIDNLPHLERLTVNHDVGREAIPLFVEAINDLKWPNLRVLKLDSADEMNLKFFDILSHLEWFETSGGRLEIPPLKGPMKHMKKFIIQETTLTDGSLQQIFKNMPNLTHLSIQLIDAMTPDLLRGAGEDYSIGNLTNLEEISLDGEWMNSKELRAVMKFPYLTLLNLGKKWGDTPMRDKDVHLLGVQCPNLMSVYEPGEGECLWSRDAKTRRFENCGNASSSEEISHSSNSDVRSDDCDCSSDDCECVSMLGAWRDIQPRYGAGSDPSEALNRCAQQ